MKNSILILVCSFFTTSAFAGDLLKDIGKGIDHAVGEAKKEVSKHLGPRPFNHELNDQNRPKTGEFWMAVVGDSSATGAVSSPNFQATWSNLLDHAQKAVANIKGDDLNPNPPEPAPLRVMYTMAEFDQSTKKGEGIELQVQTDMSQKIDTEEYSFGYILGRKLNLNPDKIVLTGQDGTRVSSLLTQFQRAQTAGPGTLPPLVLVSYVANDLCGPTNFSEPTDVFKKKFTEELKAQFTEIAKLKADPRGTHVVILAPLDVSNILTNEHLLSQKVKFEGSTEVTCKQIRDGKTGGGDLAKAMQNTLIGECRGVLSSSDQPEVRLQRLRDLQDIQAAALKEAVDGLNQMGTSISAEYADSTKHLDFQPGDLANDCFHPSKAGATRIANELLAKELSKQVPR